MAYFLNKTYIQTNIVNLLSLSVNVKRTHNMV